MAVRQDDPSVLAWQQGGGRVRTGRVSAGSRWLWLVMLLALLPLSRGLHAEPLLPTVIVLSWDGLRHDYPDLHPDSARLPAMARMARDGARAQRLTPVFPANTFPGHVSLATGTYPDRHGIPDNVFLDREKGLYQYSAEADWIEAEPLWIAAERQGVPAATYFWVGSETDWRGQGVHYRMAPFESGRPESEKVDQILAWLELPVARRPRLIMSYWAGADSAGHLHGPDSPEVIEALESQDRELGRLLAALDAADAWAHTTLLVVSDHGMLVRGESLELAAALTDAGINARCFGSAVAHVFLDDLRQLEPARRIATGLGHTRVFTRAEVPASLRLAHPQRTGDLVVLADPPYTLDRPAGVQGVMMLAAQMAGSQFGIHGYDPALPEMGGAFLAIGRGVPPGARLGEVRQIDVAATVAGLLGIEPPLDSEGRPVPGLGVGAAVRTSADEAAASTPEP